MSVGSDAQGAELERGALIVDYCGELHVVEVGDTLVFGRSAELEVDDNEFLHRQLGCFERRDGLRWLANVGSRIELEVFDRDTQVTVRLPSGTAQPLPGADALVQFTAGPTHYELLVRCHQGVDIEPAEPSDTMELSSLPWTEEQRLLMVVMAESLLRHPHLPLTLPTNDEAQDRLGWGRAKFNRKLDNVCDRLGAAGIRGLGRGQDRRNNQRRQVLAEIVVEHGIVTADDLDLLDQHRSGGAG